MAVKRKARRFAEARDESGQSVLEFLFMLPVMVGLILILLRMNSAIQVSIVNQKYARIQAVRLAFNSPWYPRRDLRDPAVFPATDQFVKYGYDRMVIGVSDLPIDETDSQAVATTQTVVRNPRNTTGDGPNQQEPDQRSLVRVRTTVALCTQLNFVDESGQRRPILGNVLSEKLQPQFCRGQDEQ